MHIPSFKLISQSMLKKSPENSDGRTDGTDGRTDGHCHSIIRPFFKRAYKNLVMISIGVTCNTPQPNLLAENLSDKLTNFNHIVSCSELILIDWSIVLTPFSTQKGSIQKPTKRIDKPLERVTPFTTNLVPSIQYIHTRTIQCNKKMTQTWTHGVTKVHVPICELNWPQ